MPPPVTAPTPDASLAAATTSFSPSFLAQRVIRDTPAAWLLLLPWPLPWLCRVASPCITGRLSDGEVASGRPDPSGEERLPLSPPGRVASCSGERSGDGRGGAGRCVAGFLDPKGSKEGLAVGPAVTAGGGSWVAPLTDSRGTSWDVVWEAAGLGDRAHARKTPWVNQSA
jgi:hypothetical protein